MSDTGTDPSSPARSSPLAIPAAIILAGVLIAGALYMSGSKTDSGTQVASAGEAERAPSAKQITVDAVTSADHILGNPNAAVRLIEYSDTECPFCKSYHLTMKKILETYGKDGSVSWIYRHFPLPQLHKKAKREAEATECAAELGGNTAFWAYLNKLFEITPSNDGLDHALLPQIASDVGLDSGQFASCLESGRHGPFVESSYEAALRAGGSGTPYTIALVSRKFSQAETQELIESTATAWQSKSGQTLPPDFLSFDETGDKVAWSGAFPFELTSSVVEHLLGR